MPTDPLDILWDQVQIAYAAIIRAQSIMYVRGQKDVTITKIGHKDGETVTEERWEVQQAWDKQGNFLQAQARAQKTLEGLIKQYDELLHKNWELASEEQKARIAQLRALTDKLTGNNQELEDMDEIEGISMAAVNRFVRKKTIPFNFSEKHKDYIRRCEACMYNVAEGAVRAGKTVDNVFAFAHELKTTPDRIHLATGSTMANAKLNIGDANGFGLEWIFRGQCHWGKYKDNEALFVKGPATHGRQKIIIFAGGAKEDSFKKIRGNSYGMWIATEINLHHDNTIKEAFNRQLAAQRLKVFWDLNPDNPRAPIYAEYIDKYQRQADAGDFPGGYNYMHCTIYDNINITTERLREVESRYDKNSIWYLRDIKGMRVVANGLIYRRFA